MRIPDSELPPVFKFVCCALTWLDKQQPIAEADKSKQREVAR
jgi:hypothetical protein